MKVILVICIVVLTILIVASYIIAFHSEKKTKRIIVVILTPVILYIIITMVLMIARGKSFVGYYVSPDTVYYNENYYTKITDEYQIKQIANDLDGCWVSNETYITSNKIKFPYLEYWMPDIFFYHVLILNENDKYIVLVDLEETFYFEIQ